MNRNKFFFWLWLIVVWLVSVGLVHWLVGGSWWLALFLGSAMATAAEIYRRVVDIHQCVVWNRHLFDISDAELVRVSALTNSLEEEAANLNSQLEEIKGRLDELDTRAMGWKR
ncbi:MAG: hypothetical protein WCC11_04570 [Gammaproteobacteria bacterium]